MPVHLGWRFMLGIGAVPSVLLALLLSRMPESPRWLVMKGRLEDARAVLEKISDTPEDAAERLADIKAAGGIPDDLDTDVAVVLPNKRRGGDEKQVWRELIVSPTPTVRRILLTAVGLNFFQQATGSDSVVLYSPRVFESAGSWALPAPWASPRRSSSWLLCSSSIVSDGGRCCYAAPAA
jgi:MFS family permease